MQVLYINPNSRTNSYLLKSQMILASKPIMMPSIPISSLFFLFLFLTFYPLYSFASSALLETCNSITATRQDIEYDFCIATLESNPGSDSADGNGLAIIATNLSFANAMGMEAKIQSLMGDEYDPSLKDCLSVCSDVYSDAIDHLSQAIVSISSRAYRDAVTFLSAALDASDNCEDAFGDLGATSPVADEDRDYRRLACIALAIAASLG